jgi:nitrite reductase/ring-hydroxylating ferredoxin subunit
VVVCEVYAHAPADVQAVLLVAVSPARFAAAHAAAAVAVHVAEFDPSDGENVQAPDATDSQSVIMYVVDDVIAGVTPSVSSHTVPVSVHADHVAVNVLAVPS